MNIATALNKKYLLYTAVMLTSLCENNKEHINAFILNSELDEDDISKLKVSLKNYDIDIISLKVDKNEMDARLPWNVQWTIEMYYRLMLPDMLPGDCDRLLYLDVDLIVNKSLNELYYMDFVGKEIMAAVDCCGNKSMDIFGEKQKEMFAPMFEQGYQYFNSGVMLLNIEKIRENHNFATYMKAVEEWNYQMEAPDQDILNYVHWQNVGYINYEKYNMFARIAHNRHYTYEQIKESVAIIHYTGQKPWDVDNVHFDIEQIWWDYAKLTPFYYQLLEKLQIKLMSDNTIEQTITMLYNENGELKGKVQQLLAINERLMKMLGAK